MVQDIKVLLDEAEAQGFFIPELIEADAGFSLEDVKVSLKKATPMGGRDVFGWRMYYLKQIFAAFTGRASMLFVRWLNLINQDKIPDSIRPLIYGWGTIVTEDRDEAKRRLINAPYIFARLASAAFSKQGAEKYRAAVAPFQL